MAQNSEQIEAKLCAYLEGELDEAGRAEIEKHLQQNPAHRKLLAEVGKTRGLLRALPRESAPPDICEAFQGQLERSVLLSDLDGEAAESSMKINRWPQYFAVAAVVMLAAGLGLVVYFGLPSGEQPGQFVIGTAGTTGGTNEDGPARGGAAAGGNAPEAAPPTTGAAAATPSTALTQVGQQQQEEARGRALRSMDESLAVAPDASGQLSKKAEAAADEAGRPTSGPAAGKSEDLPALADRVKNAWDPTRGGQLFAGAGSGGGGGGAGAGVTPDATPEATVQALAALQDNAMCYVVTSARPAMTSERIGQQLSSLNVAWSAVPRPDAETLWAKLPATLALAPAAGPSPAGGAVALADVQTRGVDKQAAEAEVRSVDRTRAAETAERKAENNPAAGAAAAPAPAPTRGPTPAGVAGAEPEQLAERDTTATVPGEAPAAEPATTPADGAPVQRYYTQGDVRPNARGMTLDAGAVVRRPETLIVARNLTRSQAEALGVSLNGQGFERQVRLGEEVALVRGQAATTAPAPAAAPSDAVINPRGEGLGARDQMARGSTPPPAAAAPANDGVIRSGDELRMVVSGGSEQSESKLQVKPDGSVDVPGIGVFVCAGMTVDQFRDRLSQDLKADGREQAGQVALSKVESKAKDEVAAGGVEATAGRETTAGRGGAAGKAGAGAGEMELARASRPDVALRMRSATPPAPQTRGGGTRGDGTPGDGAAAARRATAARPAPGRESQTVAGGATAEDLDRTAGAPGAGTGVADAEEFAVKPQAPAQMPASAPAPAQPPTQAPGGAADDVAAGQTFARSGLAASDADDRFDVVILVQSDGEGAASTTAPAAAAPGENELPDLPGPIARFDILSVTVGEGEEGLTNVRVGEDGTVELPRAGRLKAEGLTSAEFRERVEARLQAAGKVTVRRLSGGDAAAGAPEDPGQTPAPAPAESAPAESPPGDPAPQAPAPAADRAR